MTESPSATGAAQQGQDTNQASTASNNPSNKKIQNNKKYQKKNNQATTTDSASKKFEGRIDDLKGHVYDTRSAWVSADLYTKTTEEILEYINRTYKNGPDVVTCLQTKTFVPPDKPEDPDPDAGETDKAIWKKKVELFVKKEDELKETLKQVHGVIYGQCSESMRDRLDALASTAKILKDKDPIGLLGNIQACMLKVEGKQNPYHTAHSAIRKLYTFSQGRLSLQQYLESFKNSVDVIEHIGCAIGPNFKELIVTEMNDTGETEDTATATVREKYLATAYLLGSDRARFGKLIDDLQNNFLQGTDNYPKTLVDAHSLLLHWKHDNNNSNSAQQQATTTGVAFAQTGSTDKSHIQCFKCKKYGHYSNNCPNQDADDDNGGDDNNGGGGTTSKTTTKTAMVAHGTINSNSDSDDSDTRMRFAFNTLGNIGETYSVTLSTQRYAGIPKSWLLLDSQSNVHVMCNSELVTNIRETNMTLIIQGTTGQSKTNLIADLPGLGFTVWFCPDIIANIISLSEATKHYRVTLDTAQGNQFIVHGKDGSKCIFHESTSEHGEAIAGLFYTEMTARNSNKTISTALITTVQDRKTKYTERAYDGAVRARKVQNALGYPSLKQFLHIIEKGLLPGTRVTRDDIIAAEDIFGPNLGGLKGKTTRTKTDHVENILTPVPAEIYATHPTITLVIDIFYVNSMAFFVTQSRNYKFGTVEHVLSRNIKTINKALTQVINLYHSRGLRVVEVNGDPEFEALRVPLANTMAKYETPVNLNTSGENDHVPEIERGIRTRKERARAIIGTLPFTRLNMLLVRELIYRIEFALNAFPPGDGVSETISPRTLITGRGVTQRHFELEFGEYVQVHEKSDNTMRPRTVGAIALRPTGNEEGSYYFMSLETGRRLNRTHWTRLPMPEEVIQRVHQLADEARAEQGLTFAWRDGTEMINEDDDEAADPDYDPNEDDSDDDPLEYDSDDEPDPIPTADDAADILFPGPGIAAAGVSEADIAELQPEEQPADPIETAGVAAPQPTNTMDTTGVPEPPEPTEEPTGDTQTGQDNQDTDLPGVNDDEEENNIQSESEENNIQSESDDTDEENDQHERSPIDDEFDQRYGPRTRQLRPRRYPREPEHKDYFNLTTIGKVVLIQYGMKRGLKIFGERGSAAVSKEMKQLHDRKVMKPVKKNMLTDQERKRALNYLMFLKEKRDGTIKGRGCADGRSQRIYKSKAETSSPTCKTESIFITAVIDAMEGRDVATVDIPGAFMQADIDETVIVRFTDEMAILLAQIDPELYDYFLDYENGKPVLYAKLLKALYGTVQAALLFWKELTSFLEKQGFKSNPYDLCVMNKTINGEQCTVVWHVDDAKISHKDPKVVSEVIALLNKKYGELQEVTENRGKIHDYLGMTIDYTIPGKVVFRMDDYVAGILEEAPDDMDGVAATPHTERLYDVSDTPTLLDSERSEIFHHLVAKLLFLAQRVRPELQPAVPFLTTRVKCADLDDWKKLGRIVKYLRKYPTLALTLEGDNLSIVKHYIDASYAVHRDMRSHTGGYTTLGKGAVITMSARQKLNTRSSTEAELVGVDDYMSMVLWTREFLNAQGPQYTVNDSIIYQDNRSAMLLEENGQRSSSRRTRHLNVRYYFITDRINQGEVRVEHCPTKDMLADLFTKPLMGGAFKDLRAKVLNITEPDDETDEDG